MTIRTKVFGVLGALVVAALVYTIVALQMARQRDRAGDDVDRTLAVLENHGVLTRTIVEMQAAQEGYALTRNTAFVQEYQTAWELYHRTITLIPDHLRDIRQLERLRDVDQKVNEWHKKVAEPLFGARSGTEEVSRLVSDGLPLANRIRDTLDAFETREKAALAEQRTTQNFVFFRATLVLLVIPAAAIVMLLVFIVVVTRVVLDPLSLVAESARQISAGNFAVKLPPAKNDEIGALLTTFRDMTAAVQRREQDLTIALERQRQIAREYAELQAKAELQREQLLATIETVPAALVIVQPPDGRILLQNKAAEDLIGPPPKTDDERRRARRRFQLLRKDGSVCPRSEWALVRALGGQVVVGQELTIRHRSGRQVPILVSAAPLRDEAGTITGAVLAAQDITQLHEVDRMKSEFVSIVSHELRTPLTSLKGALQLVLDEELMLPKDERMQLLRVALTSTDRLIRIINDILDISKVEAGGLKLQLKPCDITDLVRLSIQSIEQIAWSSSVRLETRLPRDVPVVMADPDRIVQAIVNLLSNALKFAPPNSVVRVEAERNGNGSVAVSVRDQGKGIPQEKIGLLFRKFQQIDGSDSRRVPGTGLGLAITKALVELHGGRIDVWSQPGVGTHFTITLPATAASALQ
jgi:PAS domain S-box-containing protein